MDRSSDIESIAFSISGLFTIAAGSVVSAAYLLGLMAGATAITTMSAIGAVLAVLAAFLIVWVFIQATKERNVRYFFPLCQAAQPT